MGTGHDPLSITKTLSGTTADTVTIDQLWPQLQITNSDATNTLWVRVGSTATPTDAVANGAGCVPVLPSSTRFLQSIPIQTGTGVGTIVLSVVGNGGDYTITGANSGIANITQLDSRYIQLTEAPLNPLDYGAVGDNATVDDAAFAAMSSVLPATGGAIRIPERHNFLLSNSWALPASVTKVKITGDGYGSIITNNTNDLFNPASAVLDRAEIGSLQLVCGASAGHIFNLATAELSQCWLHDLLMIQNNPAKALMIIPVGVSGGMVDTVCERWWATYAANRSVAGIDVQNPTIFDNTFRNMRLTDSGAPTTWMMFLKATAGVAANNKFEAINFEGPLGGAIRLLAHYFPVLDRIWLWDMVGTTTNHLISIGQVSSQPTTKADISRVYRNAGTLGSGLRDVFVEGAGQAKSTYIHDIGQSSGGSAVAIDLNSSLDALVERLTGAITPFGYHGTVAVGAGAGTGATTTGPTVSMWNGVINVTLGSSPAAGAQVTYTVPNNMSVAPLAVLLQPENAASWSAGLYVSAKGTTGFTVSAVNAPGGNLSFSFRIERGVGSNGP